MRFRLLEKTDFGTGETFQKGEEGTYLNQKMRLSDSLTVFKVWFDNQVNDEEYYLPRQKIHFIDWLDVENWEIE